MHAKTKKTSKGARNAAVVDKAARRKEPPSRLVLVVALVLAAATLAVYWGTFRYEFTIGDDNTYVTGNPPVLAGLNAKSVAWAFSSGYAANWHPLTWLSLMLDAQIGGENPAIYHIANVIIHVVNVLLLFLLLTSVTRLIWPSAFVAGLFALHPLQVESVAWVSERKDVLGALFWMLTSLAYVRYARKSNRANYALVLALFALGLMAKQMLVTLPVVFLLLDYWPLGRVGSKRLSALLIEKAPMIALSVLAGVLAIWAQAAGGSMRGVEKYPLGVRAAYAPVSYIAHLGKAVLPVDLAVFYPHPGTSLPEWKVIGSTLLLVCLTALAIVARKKRPYLFVGWLWFLVVLLPMVGLMQSGEQAMCDHHSYISIVGLLLMVSWGLSEVASRASSAFPSSAAASAVVPALAIAVLVALGVSARHQAGYWHDSVTLFEHTLSVTRNNPVIENHLGAALCALNRVDEAVPHCREAVRLSARYPEAHYNLAHCLQQQGDIQAAIAEYQKAIQEKPDYAKAHNDLAFVYLNLGRYDDVIDHCTQALRTRPDYPKALANLAIAYYYKADYQKAWEEAQLCERYSGRLPPGLVQDIAAKLR